MSHPTTQRMGFRLNQKKVLRDLILHQAGTLEKACAEGIMNGIDAGASTIQVEISQDSVRIRDDGRGFRSVNEIREYFGTIGAEHDPSEGKRFGRFRMGRGQMFKYGVNMWRSNTFAMHVDIQSPEWEDPNVEEPPFLVTEGLEPVQGCDITIALYQPLLPSEILAVTQELERMARYVDVTVEINGKVINRPPEKEKWDVITDDAYIRLTNTGSLEIYNDGIYVMTLPAHRFGTGGVVVSKGVFTGINYARNEIDSRDPKWRRIQQHLKQGSEEKVRHKAQLSDSEREFIVAQIMAGEYKSHNAYKQAILYDTTGRAWSGNAIMSHIQRHRIPVITVAEDGDFRADTLMQRRLAFVFSKRTQDMFGASSPQNLVDILREKRILFSWVKNFKVVDFEEAAKNILTDHRLLLDEDLTPKERFLLNFIRSVFERVIGHNEFKRRIVVGESETAYAWTDGSTYIAIERRQLHAADSIYGWCRIAELLHHENTHEDSTSAQHLHTPEFYRSFHDGAVHDGFIRDFITYCVKEFPTALEREKKKLTRQQAKLLDWFARADFNREKVYDLLEETRLLEVTKDRLRRVRKNAGRPRKKAAASVALSGNKSRW